jgi:hypothetical protein
MDAVRLAGFFAKRSLFDAPRSQCHCRRRRRDHQRGMWAFWTGFKASVAAPSSVVSAPGKQTDRLEAVDL